MAQLAQSLRLDLTDSLTSHSKVLTDFLQRMLAAVRSETETHLDHFLLARCQGLQNFLCNLPEVDVYYRLGGILDSLVLDEIA